MLYLLLVVYQGIMSRLSGSGFGQKWNVSWLPEALFSIPFGLAHAYGWYVFNAEWITIGIAAVLASVFSFAFMQSGTWMFLRWEKHDDPNTTRGGTLKPIIDFIAGRFGYKIGDEGYSWIAAGVKGFFIGLPVGGIMLAILWPLGYEIGSHAKGRTEKYGIDPHTVAEIAAGVGAGIAIVSFLLIL